MKARINFLVSLLLFSSVAMANSESGALIAEVVKLRGEITQLSPGARLARKVNLGDKFVEDTSIVTGPKSFIKIKLIDNSELNVGPESKVVITEMKKDSVGIISLLKGRIRTEVQKDAKDPEANKFFVKTRTAALGVRGTEFQTIYNPDNKMTSLLTYKGEVAMAKVDEKTFARLENAPSIEVVRDDVTKEPEIVETPAKKLDEHEELNKILKNKSAVIVPPGQSSFSSDSLKKTSLPVKISPVQLDALYKNEDFNEKSESNLKLQSAVDAINYKPMLKTAAQSAPAEGFYNAKTGDFAPKSGGFIDLNTGLYVAPSVDSKLDAKSGVYVANQIGDIDADTGQYVAPKGLVLDANKGFILVDDQTKTELKPELLAMREDLNKNIAKDIVVGASLEDAPEAFNINEKFIRDRITFSLWSMNQTLKANENSNTDPYVEVDSLSAVRLGFEWRMSSVNRFAPVVGIDYGIVDYKDKSLKGISQDSKKLLGLSFGFQYALSKSFNLYTKFGLHQDHQLDQTADGMTRSYDLKKIVLTRLGLGVNAEFWRKHKFSLDASLGGFVTFRKRINNLVINEGGGLQFEVLPKYALSEKKWIGLGIKVENQAQKVGGTVRTNSLRRDTGGLELKYISDF